jgi:putative flippase GtrA
MKSALLSTQFLRFLVTGGIAALINIGSRVLYDRFLPFWAAVMLAYASGMITAFLLARRFVFTGGQSRVARSSFRFFVVNMLGLAQTSIVSIGLGDYLLPALGIVRHAHDLAHPVGVAAPVFVSFVAHRHWTFKADRVAEAGTSPPEEHATRPGSGGREL